MARARQVEVAQCVTVGDEDVDVVVQCKVTPESGAYEGLCTVEGISAIREDTGAALDLDAIAQDDWDRISERAADRAQDIETAAAECDADEWRDRRRDDRLSERAADRYEGRDR